MNKTTEMKDFFTEEYKKRINTNLQVLSGEYFEMLALMDGFADRLKRLEKEYTQLQHLASV